LIDANSAAERMTGRTLHDWRGKTFDEIWPAAKELGISNQFLNVAVTGTPFVSEDLVYSDNGLAVDTIVNVFMLPNNRLAVCFVDITQRKRVEKELERSRDEIQALASDLELRVEQRTLRLNELNAQLLSLIKSWSCSPIRMA